MGIRTLIFVAVCLAACDRQAPQTKVAVERETAPPAATGEVARSVAEDVGPAIDVARDVPGVRDTGRERDDSRDAPGARASGLTGNFVREFTSVRDGMRHRQEICVRELARGELQVAGVLRGSAGHSCAFDYRVEPVWVRGRGSAQEYRARADCEFRVTVTDETITLEDPEGQCQQINCGVRVSIDGTTFRRSSRQDYDAEACSERAL